MTDLGGDGGGLPTGAHERLKEIIEIHGLGAEVEPRLTALLMRLATDKRAPTTVKDPAVAVDSHIADSLVALDLDAVRRAGVLADVGSGAGLPGLALAAALPGARVALVESQTSKCSFIAVLATAMGLPNARIVCARVEDWQEGIGAHDLVTARALAAQPVVLEYAAPLLALGGILVDWRGRRQPEEEKGSLRAAEFLGLSRTEVRRVQPFRGADDRHLHIFEKQVPTPSGFPRRAGQARKKPLGTAPA
jgi:16S rRNA (guanine527-N7)-methyltransferase